MATKKAITTAEIIRTRDGALPFVVTSKTKRGRWVDTDAFDPEIHVGSRGDYEGIEALALLLTQLRKKDGTKASLHVREVLIDAGKKASLRKGPSEWAAFSFMTAVEPMLKFAAEHADWETFLAEKMASAQRYQHYEADRKATAKEQFVTRMRAAKTARSRSCDATPTQTGTDAQRSGQVCDLYPVA